ncbi:MAG: Holliday junction branch migration DNA helicase RuvB, partial [Acholeplasmatales bacterium]|nr:Holliday junction branch migration DNA helicase RuvB [Acholeplasmatales bacterium]
VVDIIIGKDDETRSIRLELEPFTLIGATTRYGDLSSPLRERFGIIRRLNFYTISELEQILERTSKIYDTPLDIEAKKLLAKCSRGTPRVANRLFRRTRDFAQILGDGKITKDIALNSLNKQGVNLAGLDDIDIRYLSAVVIKFKGGPVGLETVATSISEEAITLSDAIEPYLIQEGYIMRTKQGRIATKKAFDELKIKYNNTLFDIKEDI